MKCKYTDFNYWSSFYTESTIFLSDQIYQWRINYGKKTTTRIESYIYLNNEIIAQRDCSQTQSSLKRSRREGTGVVVRKEGRKGLRNPGICIVLSYFSVGTRIVWRCIIAFMANKRKDPPRLVLRNTTVPSIPRPFHRVTIARPRDP